MSDIPVLFEVDGDIATITLNRPKAGNALDAASAEALFDHAIRCDLDPAIRCVVLKGEGKLFCGGGDVGGFSAAGDDIGAYLSKLAGVLHMAVIRLMRMPKPLLVAVNGPAAGAGMSIALAGDVVIAGRSASFSTAYGAIGLTADGGMSWLLPRLIGMRRTQDLLLTSRRVDSAEALEIGLVTRVVDDEALAEETARTAQVLAAGAVNAAGRIKDLLLSTLGESLEGQLEREVRMVTQSGLDAESREGVAAFLEKRKPDFKGA
ncbi:enoyl-CoA hydratase/isomerase family protein [Croceicoccus bisphenolivorans]|uniref:enoyl-CoA hydratase/isomerase family protein n=1 Tax=Croceicoccus bisphenolivorans TaxID=1783232 RepID=UPI00082EFF61|nr:enoyl-CoA hydratase-related protein [Croceicoccus bisphenolivorans]